MTDLHVHLWEHSAVPLRVERAVLAAYCDAAASRGVETIAITEHLERFRQTWSILAEAWADDPNPDLRAFMDRVFEEEQGADLDEYVSDLLRAQDAGLPVLIGIEYGWWPEQADALSRLLAGYPFDLVLGSVHNLGAWMFDAYNHPAVAAEWERRDPDAVWEDYVAAVEQLAASESCDVLAHLDLIKITGVSSAHEEHLHARLADAAAVHDLAVEVSSAGWRKPVNEPYPSPPLLRQLYDRGVPVTVASDAHRPAEIAYRLENVRELLAETGYTNITTFHRRKRYLIPLRR